MKKFVQKYLRNTRRGGKEIGSNETFPRTALSKNKMFVSAANRGERGVRSVSFLEKAKDTGCWGKIRNTAKKRKEKKTSSKLISEQFNFALDS